MSYEYIVMTAYVLNSPVSVQDVNPVQLWLNNTGSSELWKISTNLSSQLVMGGTTTPSALIVSPALGDLAVNNNVSAVNANMSGVYQKGGNRILNDDTNSNLLVGLSTGTPSGTQNTLVGRSAGSALAGGGSNTIIGQSSGTGLTSGSSNIFVGQSSGTAITTTSNNIDIGNAGIVGDSGVIRIGTSGTHTSTVLPSTVTPAVNATYNLGSSSFQWNNLYLSSAIVVPTITFPNGQIVSATVTTTNATPTTLSSFTVNSSTAYTFFCEINAALGASSAMTSFQEQDKVNVNASGVVTITNIASVTLADSALTTATLTVSSTGANNYTITVTGIASTTIKWGGLIRIISQVY